MLITIILLLVLVAVLAPRAIADASLTELRYAKESTFGVSPTTAYQAIRMVSESLGQDKEAVQSDEIVSDRRPPDNIQVNSGASGNIVCEATGGNATDANATWDDFWTGTIGSSAFGGGGVSETVNTTTNTVTPTNGGQPDRIQIARTTGNWNASFTVGFFVNVTGFTGVRAVLNSVYQVVSGGGTNTLVLTKGPRVPGGAGTETTATALKIDRWGFATDGTTFASFSIERKYSLASEFALSSGMVLTGFKFEMQPKRPMRITWDWIGLQEITRTTAIGSPINPAVTSRKTFSPVSDMKSFSIGENGNTFQITSFSLDFRTGVYPQDEEAGTLGPQGIGLGTFAATGSFEFYYEGGATSSQLFDFAQGFTEKSLHWSCANVAGDGLCFELPRVNFMNPRRGTPGKDQAIKGRMDFRAAKGTNINNETFLLRISRK